MNKKLIIAVMFFMALALPRAWSQNTSGAPGAGEHRGAGIRTIRLAGPLPVDSYPWRAAQLLYGEAFRRLGYDFALEGLPLERALVEADAGRLDGDAGRIQFDEELAAQYPNLLQVPAIIATFEVVAYTMDPGLRLNGWSDLEGKNLIIGHHRGHKSSFKKLLAHVSTQNIFEISNIRQGLKMLIRGRLDILISSKILVESVIADNAFKDSGIMLAGVLDEIYLYPYLHKNNKPLIPRLASALNAMKKDGSFDRLVAQAGQNRQQ